MMSISNMEKTKIDLLRQTIANAEAAIKKAKAELEKEMSVESDEIMGTFDGQYMRGDDGKNYPVPANYASKSMLVEGDRMKFIQKDGKFLYKQVRQADRIEAFGTVTEIDGKICVLSGGNAYRILSCSVTYYKLKSGDQVSIAIPKDGGEWAAVQGVVRNAPRSSEIAPGGERTFKAYI